MEAVERDRKWKATPTKDRREAVLENLIRLGMSGLNGANVQRAAVTTAGKSDRARVTAS